MEAAKNYCVMRVVCSEVPQGLVLALKIFQDLGCKCEIPGRRCVCEKDTFEMNALWKFSDGRFKGVSVTLICSSFVYFVVQPSVTWFSQSSGIVIFINVFHGDVFNA